MGNFTWKRPLYLKKVLKMHLTNIRIYKSVQIHESRLIYSDNSPYLMRLSSLAQWLAHLSDKLLGLGSNHK